MGSCNYWSRVPVDDDEAYYLHFDIFGGLNTQGYNRDKWNGFAVRAVKDIKEE